MLLVRDAKEGTIDEIAQLSHANKAVFVHRYLFIFEIVGGVNLFGIEPEIVLAVFGAVFAAGSERQEGDAHHKKETFCSHILFYFGCSGNKINKTS